MRLADFIAKIGQAGVEASRAVERHSRERLEEAFVENCDGVLEPKTITVKLNGEEVEVPIISLLPMKRPDLSKLRARFSSTVSLDDGCTMHNSWGLLKKAVDIDVVLEFVAEDNAESTELLRDHVNKELSVKLGNLNVHQ